MSPHCKASNLCMFACQQQKCSFPVPNRQTVLQSGTDQQIMCLPVYAAAFYCDEQERNGNFFFFFF